jgi:methylglyoxal/glyoxal reductase
MKITDITGKISLNNGVEMPYFGLGTWQAFDHNEVKKAVKIALEKGYRLIDTATFYQNEKGIGEAINESGIPREDIFITTKVWNDDQGFEPTLKAFEKSTKLLNTNYIDLYLIHWPVTGKYIETWKALEKIYADGRVKAIGISNFLQIHLDKLLPEVNITPAVNQMEFHPYLVQQPLVDLCKKNNIVYQAWSPIMQGKVSEIELLTKIGSVHGKSPAQVVLRWDLQRGIPTIPKSTNEKRIVENAQLFDFELTTIEMTLIDSLDKNQRLGYDPMLV